MFKFINKARAARTWNPVFQVTIVIRLHIDGPTAVEAIIWWIVECQAIIDFLRFQLCLGDKFIIIYAFVYSKTKD